MKDDAKTQLDRILAVYDEKLAEVERVAAATRAAQEEFPARFATLRTGTIRPALEELAKVLSARGHTAAVREQERSSSTAGGVTLAAVSLRVIPKPFSHQSPEKRDSFIEITFAANESERKVGVSSTNTMINFGGSVGKRGEYELAALTGDVVVGHVIQMLQDAFTGTR
jgi:hypothetical protein